jgi:hypothetical protein
MTIPGDKIPEEKWFYFSGGRRASDIEELKSFLEGMDENEFKNHVNNEKNDFATWVEHVFNENKLAHDMREVLDKDGMVIILEDFLEKKKHEEEEEKIQEQDLEVEKKLAGHHKPEHRPERKAEHREEHREEHRKEAKKVIISPDKKLSLEPEKELSEAEIKKLVDEAMQVFEKRGEINQEKESEEADQEKEDLWEDKWAEKMGEKQRPREEPVKAEKIRTVEVTHSQLVIKEFFYGFIIGLIFGLIMLGVIINLRFA